MNINLKSQITCTVCGLRGEQRASYNQIDNHPVKLDSVGALDNTWENTYILVRHSQFKNPVAALDDQRRCPRAAQATR